MKGHDVTELANLQSFIKDHRPVGRPLTQLVRPWDGVSTGMVFEAGPEGVAEAVAVAQAAFRKFKTAPLAGRLDLLRIAADALEREGPALARIISEDVGKPIRIAQIEVKRGAEFLRGCLAVAAHLGGETVPLDSAIAGAGCFGFVRNIPYGIVAAITPFNAPVNLLLQKVAPAVAAGNAVIAKPAIAGLRTALKLAELFVEAGWPEGLFTVLSGDRDTAAELVRHKDVRAVSFTGGTAGGHALAAIAGGKKFTAELGSNAANIVFADADVGRAAAKIAAAGFEASGQQCISAQRVLVHKSVIAEFTDRFSQAAQALRVGDPGDSSTDIGPMVSEAAAVRVIALFDDACSRGGVPILVPRRERALVSPGIVGNVTRDCRLWNEEAFGPIVGLAGFESAEEAFELANDSEFGLQGAVFTRSLQTAFQAAQEFDVGALWINEASRFRLDMYPFGGVKNSGVGREGLRYAIEEMSQLKFIGINPQ